MSWQQYVDQSLLGTGFCQQAAILGLEACRTGAAQNAWAASAGFAVAGPEGQALFNIFNNPGDAFANGIKVAGNKYLAVKADNRSAYGKKGATGVVCVKTTQAILVACYNENVQPGQCTNAVEKLADYLIENGY